MEKKMKIPHNVTKLLLSNIKDKNYLLFELGKNNVYLRNLKEIKITEDTNHNLFIATVHYKRKRLLERFLKNKIIKSKRIFKSAIIKEGQEKSLLYTVASNLLPLIEGKVLRIKSKRSRQKLTKQIKNDLYKACIEVNNQRKHNVTFDFDDYDIEAEVRVDRILESDKILIVVMVKGIVDE